MILSEINKTIELLEKAKSAIEKGDTSNLWSDLVNAEYHLDAAKEAWGDKYL